MSRPGQSSRTSFRNRRICTTLIIGRLDTVIIIGHSNFLDILNKIKIIFLISRKYPFRLKTRSTQ